MERRTSQEEGVGKGEGRWQNWHGSRVGTPTGRTSCLVGGEAGLGIRSAWGPRPEAVSCTHSDRDGWCDLSNRSRCGLSFPSVRWGQETQVGQVSSQPFHPQRTHPLLLVHCRWGTSRL